MIFVWVPLSSKVIHYYKNKINNYEIITSKAIKVLTQNITIPGLIFEKYIFNNNTLILQ